MDFLNLALDQAKLAIGLCYPNPAVGAVIVKNNEVIASGFTQKPGDPRSRGNRLRICHHLFEFREDPCSPDCEG